MPVTIETIVRSCDRQQGVQSVNFVLDDSRMAQSFPKQGPVHIALVKLETLCRGLPVRPCRRAEDAAAGGEQHSESDSLGL